MVSTLQTHFYKSNHDTALEKASPTSRLLQPGAQAVWLVGQHIFLPSAPYRK